MERNLFRVRSLRNGGIQTLVRRMAETVLQTANESLLTAGYARVHFPERMTIIIDNRKHAIVACIAGGFADNSVKPLAFYFDRNVWYIDFKGSCRMHACYARDAIANCGSVDDWRMLDCTLATSAGDYVIKS
jgi:hypothetical protein